MAGVDLADAVARGAVLDHHCAEIGRDPGEITPGRMRDHLVRVPPHRIVVTLRRDRPRKRHLVYRSHHQDLRNNGWTIEQTEEGLRLHAPGHAEPIPLEPKSRAWKKLSA